MFGYLVIACFIGVAASAPYGGAIVDTVSIPKYEFNYAVSDPHTGDNKAQSEIRNGGVVRGSYSLAEPDGTIRVVDYAADPLTGFNAKVKRIGTAVHPQTVQIAPVISKAVVGPISSGLIGPNLGVLGYNNHLGLGSLGLGNLGLGHVGLGNLGAWNIGVPLGGLGLSSLALNNGWVH